MSSDKSHNERKSTLPEKFTNMNINSTNDQDEILFMVNHVDTPVNNNGDNFDIENIIQ